MKSGVETCTGQEDKSHKHLLLLLSSQSSEKHTYPSTSGTYYAIPAVRCQLDEPAASESEPDDLNISMLSLDPPSEKKDVTFVPHSSTSASSTTTTTEEEEEQPWQERKWIVNESALMLQFRICQECGSLISGKNITTVGSLINIIWQCEQGHKGYWKSCSDVRGMPSNNLLVSASTVFTGSTYADISEWAAVLNLQVLHKTTFNVMQSSYLIPAIDEVFKEQQSAVLDTLKAGSTERKEIHLSGDGRSDSPGYSAKYTTYSLMDDITDKVVHFELVQVTESSSSVAMESTGFWRALKKILDDNIGVSVVTTDRSPSIRKIMRVDYQNIHHEFDVWHVAKGRKLEVFHSLLLKYCPKRIHFHYTSMLARTQLAVLDHNENVHRQQARTNTETMTYTCHYMPERLERFDLKISQLDLLKKKRYLHLGCPWEEDTTLPSTSSSTMTFTRRWSHGR